MDYNIDRPGWTKHAYAFQEFMAPVSSYPLSYIYATWLAISGHILGRSTWVQYGAHELFANQYMCLLGGSGTHHKSTALKAAMLLQGAERLEANPPVRALTTEQGMLVAINNAGGNVLIVIDELANMLVKKRQDFAASLLSQLVNLYDCPSEAGNYTKYDPIIVTNPYTTFMAASTMEWLRETLTTTDMLAGFGNRMSWVLGDPRPPKPWPASIDTSGAEVMFNNLEMFAGELHMTQDALDMWGWYYPKFQKLQKDSPPFLQTMAERLPDKALKAAIIHAAWDDSLFIEQHHLKAGIDWADYLHECLLELLPAFGNREQNILAAIKKGKDTKQKLYAYLSHKFTSEAIGKSLKSLEGLKVIQTAGSKYQVVDTP